MKIAILAATLAVSAATALGAQTATGTASGAAGGSSDGMSSGMTGTNAGASMTSSGMTDAGAAGNASAAGSGVTGASGTGTTGNGVAADTAGSAGAGMATSAGQPANTAGTNAAAPVQGAAAVQMQPLPAQDFVTAAASGGLFEVESSKLALERTKSDEVKAFAEMMIADHSKANDELKAIAAAAGLKVPAAPEGGPAEHLKAVKAAADADFDRTYLMHQDKAHDETLALFMAQAGATSTPELAAFAAKTLPALKMHAEHVKKLVK